MKFLGLICLVCFLPLLAPALAQEEQQGKGDAKPLVLPKYAQRVVEVKNADVRQLSDLLNLGGGLVVRFNEHFRTISLGGPETQVAEAEKIIQRFDAARPVVRPSSRNIELVVYMLTAAAKGTAGDALPADLESAARQLKQIFGYNDFRLLDSAVLRVREGEKGESSGNASFATGATTAMALYQMRFTRALVSTSEKGNVIRLDDFRFGIRAPYSVGGGNVQYADLGFTTNLDIREGQKAVVGKAKYDGSDNAFVLVVTAKVVD